LTSGRRANRPRADSHNPSSVGVNGFRGERLTDYPMKHVSELSC